MNRIFLYTICLVGLGSLVSCNDPNSTGWEFARNMYDAVGYEPQSQIEKNSNNKGTGGSNMREPVQGTIARRNFQTKFAKDDSSSVEDLMFYNLTPEQFETLENPIAWSEEAEAEGQALYERNCLHCHGSGGAGDGKVGKVYKGVPNYSTDAYKNMTSGHIYNVITNGKGRMWPLKGQVTPIERWKIVHYVHRLQLGS
ncbi:MAG: c-type cytochrome [Leadbetterella sp.]